MNEARFRVSASALVLALTVPTPAQEPKARRGIPAGAALERAEAKVAEHYGARLDKASSPDERRSLGTELYMAGLETRIDMDSRCVLLLRAKELFEQAGDVSRAVEAAEAIAKDYRVDPLTLAKETLEAVAPRVPEPQAATLQEEILLLLYRATGKGRFDVAEAMGSLVKARTATSEGTEALLSWMRVRRDASRKAQVARLRLAQKPEDPSANAKLGGYLCFTLGDWRAGLPHLARGDDEVLAMLARAELGGRRATADRVTLAGRWWAAAARSDGSRGLAMRRHAARIYLEHRAGLGGLDRKEADKRIAEVRKTDEGRIARAALLRREGKTRLAKELLEAFGDLGGDAALQAASLADALPERALPRFPRPFVPALYHGRRKGRATIARRGGAASAEAIRKGLDWLMRHQDPKGHWDVDGFMKLDTKGEPCDGEGHPLLDIGVSALALLAFLGDGSTPEEGPYRRVVRRGIDWLRSKQNKRNGRFVGGQHHGPIYDHAIATHAMIEAYGLSGDQALRDSAVAALSALEAWRNPKKVWHYMPRNGKNDSSVTGWCTMACVTGRHFELPLNARTFEFALAWFDEATDPATGRLGYSKRGESSSRDPGDHTQRFPLEKGEALTAAGLLCRFALGQDPKRHPIMTKAADMILSKPAVWDEEGGSIDHYYWYYATQAMFQMGGRYWRDWRKALIAAVVKAQRRDGNYDGSWDPIGVWGHYGGRVYSTALLTMALETPFRYARLLDYHPVPNREARQHWDRRRFGKVAEVIAALREKELSREDRQITALIQHLLEKEVAKAMKRVRSAREPLDYLAAKETLETILREFEGLEPAKAAAKELQRYRSPELRLELRAAKRLRRIRDRKPGSTERVRALRALISDYGGTRAAEAAEKQLKKLGR